MADTIEQVRQTARLLRAWGFTVVEVSGWERRGSGSLTTAGRLEHHTAGARHGDTPSLRVVTFGRAGLRNSLCRWYVSRSGVIYLVARRSSWHAGRGDKGSNRTLSGTEAEHTGSTSEPWTKESLDAQAAISTAECLVYGMSPARIWDHKSRAAPLPPTRTARSSARRRSRHPAWKDSPMPEDPADLYEVPEDERLDTDEGEGANALEGGADDDLADVYENPGEVWEGPQ